MVDGMTMLMEREKCEKNLYFKELWDRMSREASGAISTVAKGTRMGFPMIKFYQGQVAAFARMLLIPDEIIEDCKPRKETEE